MKALSLRQPWAWAVVEAGKDVENRRWNTKFRGDFLIHAASGWTKKQYRDSRAWIETLKDQEGVRLVKEVPPMALLERGGIVGVATLVDVLPPSDTLSFFPRPWHVPGQWGFVLENVRPLPFRACHAGSRHHRPYEPATTEGREPASDRDSTRHQPHDRPDRRGAATDPARLRPAPALDTAHGPVDEDDAPTVPRLRRARPLLEDLLTRMNPRRRRHNKRARIRRKRWWRCRVYSWKSLELRIGGLLFTHVDDIQNAES